MFTTTSSTLFGLEKSLVGPPRNPCCLEMLDHSSGPPPLQAKIGIIKSSVMFYSVICCYNAELCSHPAILLVLLFLLLLPDFLGLFAVFIPEQI